MQEIGAIDRTQLPADIRTAGVEQQQQYAAAQQFEQMLVQKMLAQATSILGADDSADSGDEEDGGESGSTDAVSTHYKDMLPELMAKTMTSGAGLGIARDLYDAMQKQKQKPA